MKKMLSVLAMLLAAVCAQAETVGNGTTKTLDLAAGQKLTVTTGASEAIVQRYNGASLIDTTGPAASTTTVFGEYFVNQQFSITALTSPVTYSVSQSTDTVRTGIAAITDGTIDSTVITDSSLSGVTAISLTQDVAFLVSDGAPEDAVQASLDANPAGDDNGLTFTAVAYGSSGNAISIEYVDPSENDAVLGVTVAGSVITVSLATGGAGAITSTAAEVLAAIEADAAADALVAVAIDAADSGVADDGSGIVTALAADLLTGGAGTGIDTAGKGSVAVDYTNGKLYINAGTLAVPVWDLVTSS